MRTGFRRLGAVTCSVAVCLLFVMVMGPLGVSGQSTTTEDDYVATIEAYQTRVAELEGTVAARGQKINAQRTQIAELKNPPATATPEAQETVTISGVGPTVTDFFTLDRGQYKVTAAVDVFGGFDGFILHLYGEHGDLGFDGYVMNELIDQNGLWTGSVVFTADRAGQYYAEVSNTSSSWTVTFEKVSSR